MRYFDSPNYEMSYQSSSLISPLSKYRKGCSPLIPWVKLFFSFLVNYIINK
ncbi:hypothetical protein HanRHA438_Chr02g0084581 [Helianthus annuus]|nr:hypothetical protein HanRHA438_Chr02g0084581 [Helianthus annuus]